MSARRTIMDSAGFSLSADALFACMMLLASLPMVMHALQKGSEMEQFTAQLRENEFFASALSEAIVKNRNAPEPETGAAYYDAQLRRVESNVLDETLLLKMRPRSFDGKRLAGVYERSGSGKKYFFHEAGGECIAAERFVVIKSLGERKAVLGVMVCEK